MSETLSAGGSATNSSREASPVDVVKSDSDDEPLEKRTAPAQTAPLDFSLKRGPGPPRKASVIQSTPTLQPLHLSLSEPNLLQLPPPPALPASYDPLAHNPLLAAALASGPHLPVLSGPPPLAVLPPLSGPAEQEEDEAAAYQRFLLTLASTTAAAAAAANVASPEAQVSSTSQPHTEPSSQQSARSVITSLPKAAAKPDVEAAVVARADSARPPSLERAASRSGRSLPDSLKDAAYWERRRKNNEAAKRSRDSRRLKEEAVTARAARLEAENRQLRAQLDQLRRDSAAVRSLLFAPPPML